MKGQWLLRATAEGGRTRESTGYYKDNGRYQMLYTQTQRMVITWSEPLNKPWAQRSSFSCSQGNSALPPMDGLAHSLAPMRALRSSHFLL